MKTKAHRSSKTIVVTYRVGGVVRRWFSHMGCPVTWSRRLNLARWTVTQVRSENPGVYHIRVAIGGVQ